MVTKLQIEILISDLRCELDYADILREIYIDDSDQPAEDEDPVYIEYLKAV